MNSRTIDVVTDWETVPTPDGYEGLHQLADTEFSGAVSAGMTWAFFLNGRVVGVFEGDIDDFGDAELTAYRAADSSLPLLFAMQERDGETQARYYTNDTPLSDADRTLSEGGFTGYVELSENVLSGDYYVVYHGGKSMSAAFVGNAERLVTGDEAFETAADEVGIYEVVDVDVDIVDIPEPETPDGESEAEAAAVAADDDSSDPETPPQAETAAEASPDETPPRDGEEIDDPPQDAGDAIDDASSPEDEAAPPSAQAPADADADPERPTNGPDEVHPDDPEREDSESTAQSEEDTTDTAAADTEVSAEATPERSEEGAETDGPDAAEREPATATGSSPIEPDDEVEPTAERQAENVFTDEERWREARSIPSLDPDRSSGDETANTEEGRSDRQSARERVAQMQRQRTARREAGKRPAREPASPNRPSDEATTDEEHPETKRLKQRLARTKERVQELQSEREELQSERDELQAELESLRTDHSEYRERIADLEAERDELQAEIERLEAELDSVAGSTDPEAAGESMSPERALSGTNLFVRYDRKGEATLEHAHDGEASREDVRSNLRLEHHTTFETDGLTVEERPYEEFLQASTEYSFADWVVTDLLYEIGETGNRTTLAGVFDAIPEIDRVELYGTVETSAEEGSEDRDFDVIFRDQMGDPLFVADLNDSRNATTEAMVGSLVGNTGTVAADMESLAAGFYVTESFYEPGALETVAEETGGGLLSRSKKLSFVKLSRKRGYHLCLVEARNGEFHLNVPDL